MWEIWGKASLSLEEAKIHLLAMEVLFLASDQPGPLLAPRGCPHSLPGSLLHLQSETANIFDI